MSIVYCPLSPTSLHTPPSPVLSAVLSVLNTLHCSSLHTPQLSARPRCPSTLSFSTLCPTRSAPQAIVLLLLVLLRAARGQASGFSPASFLRRFAEARTVRCPGAPALPPPSLLLASSLDSSSGTIPLAVVATLRQLYHCDPIQHYEEIVIYSHLLPLDPLFIYIGDS